MDLEDLSTETVRYQQITNVQILPTLALLVGGSGSDEPTHGDKPALVQACQAIASCNNTGIRAKISACVRQSGRRHQASSLASVHSGCEGALQDDCPYHGRTKILDPECGGLSGHRIHVRARLSTCWSVTGARVRTRPVPALCSTWGFQPNIRAALWILQRRQASNMRQASVYTS
jgi:hypothetical protein